MAPEVVSWPILLKNLVLASSPTKLDAIDIELWRGGDRIRLEAGHDATLTFSHFQFECMKSKLQRIPTVHNLLSRHPLLHFFRKETLFANSAPPDFYSLTAPPVPLLSLFGFRLIQRRSWCQTAALLNRRNKGNANAKIEFWLRLANIFMWLLDQCWHLTTTQEFGIKVLRDL